MCKQTTIFEDLHAHFFRSFKADQLTAVSAKNEQEGASDSNIHTTTVVYWTDITMNGLILFNLWFMLSVNS